MLWIILVLIILLFVAASRLRNRPLQPAAPWKAAENVIQQQISSVG